MYVGRAHARREQPQRQPGPVGTKGGLVELEGLQGLQGRLQAEWAGTGVGRGSAHQWLPILGAATSSSNAYGSPPPCRSA